MTDTPQWMTYAQTLLALVFVCGLIYVTAALVRKFGLDKRLAGPRPGTRRMQVLETLYLDPRRRLVLVRHDAQEHLLLLGVTGDVVVATSQSGEAHAE